MLLSALLLPALAVTPTAENSVLNRPEWPVAIRLEAELGTLVPVAHTIQFGRDGSVFDYVEEGGQNNLFPFLRFDASFDIGKRNTVRFLYQPLDLRSEVTAARDLRIDGVDFAKGTPMDLRYGFSFVRGTWLFDLMPDQRREASLGLALQIRNAAISWTAVDGSQRVDERNVGPVPLLAGRLRLPVTGRFYMGAEATGFYAPIKYLNGGSVDVEGAILDASLRGGLTLQQGVDTFVSLRYVGGGSSGTGKDSDGDGYNDNWLHFMVLSLGAQLR
jgi:hypothetical protein